VTSATGIVLGLAGLGAGVTLVAFILAGARRSSVFGLGLAFVAVLAGLFEGRLLPDTSAGIRVGLVTVYAADLVAFVFLAVATERHLAWRRRVNPVAMAAAVFLAIVTISFLRGAVEHDAFVAANQYRGYLYVAAAVIYFAGDTRIGARHQQLAGLWIKASYVLAFIALARWLAPLEPVFGPISASGPGGVGRPIDAGTTFVILMGAYLALHQRDRWWTAGGLLLAVVAFQHRTVWVAATTGLTILLLGSERRQLTRFAGIAVTVFLAMSVASPAFVDSVTEPLDQAARERGTYEWRVEGWTVSLEDQLRTPGDWLVGRSMGTPWDRRLYGQVVTVSPHSLYVELMLRAGVVGLGSFLLIYLLVLRAGLLAKDKRLVTLTFAIVASQLIYAIPYKPDLMQGALIGILGALLASATTANGAGTPVGATRAASR
jgi:hypothetical protein